MRSFFWRYRDAFIGKDFVLKQPKYLFFYPVLVFLPLYSFLQLQNENVYYDEYDGEIQEKQLVK